GPEEACQPDSERGCARVIGANVVPRSASGGRRGNGLGGQRDGEGVPRSGKGAERDSQRREAAFWADERRGWSRAEVAPSSPARCNHLQEAVLEMGTTVPRPPLVRGPVVRRSRHSEKARSILTRMALEREEGPTMSDDDAPHNRPLEQFRTYLLLLAR